jgi:twitching motility protein PilT
VDITTLLAIAVQAGASDLHLSSDRVPMVRVDGDLKKLDQPTLSRNDVHRMIHDVLSDTQRKYFEENLELDFAHDLGESGRFRVNAFVHDRGEGAVFRAIPREIPSLEDLGLPQSLRQLCEKDRGLILFTGPTGSGKTTSQAAMIDLINAEQEAHIVTIEDPIEFIHSQRRCLVSQRELGTHTRSFSNALRAALREDPDVILVGEMRDRETIQLALTAAETGHLVLATLHAQSALSSCDRIIDVFPGDQQPQIRIQFADTILAVVMQTLCKRIGGGRVAGAEILMANVAIRNLIRERKTHMIPGVMQSGRKEGMQTLDMALSDLVQKGQISVAEARQRSMGQELFNNITVLPLAA